MIRSTILILFLLLLPLQFGRTTYSEYVKGYNKGWSWGWRKCLGKKSVPMQPPYPDYSRIYGRANRFDGFIDGAGDGYDAASKFKVSK